MNSKGLKLLLWASFSLSACANKPSTQRTDNYSEVEKAPYWDAAFDDHNRAPAALVPPAQAANGELLDPTYLRTQADYNFSMGESFSLEGQYQKAIESFKTTLIYDPASTSVRMRLASEYVRLGMLSEAVHEAEEVVTSKPDNVEAKLLLGGLYSSMRAFDRAVEQYEGVLKKQPNHLEAPLYLGAVYSEQKQYEKAIKQFEILLKNPEYTSPHLAQYYVGRVRVEQGDAKSYKLAELAYKKSLASKPDFSDAAISLGQLYSKQGQEEKAVKYYATFQKEHGPNLKIAEILSQVYIEREMYDEAFEQLEIQEAQGDDVLSVRLKMALILIEKKMYSNAATKLEDVIKEAPDSDKVRFYLGAVYEELKQPEKSVFHFKKLPAHSQFFPDATVHACFQLKSLGRIDDAVLLMESALKQKNDNPNMFAMYVSMLDEKNDFKKAETVLESAVKAFPDNAQIFFYYGTIQDRLGKKPAVIDAMKKVIELDPNHVQGLNYLAFTWAEQKANLSEAEKLARRAAVLEPKDGYIMDTLGWILYQQGKYSESIKVLESAVRNQPTVSLIAEHLGDAYYRSSMVEKAKRMYDKAVDLESDIRRQEELRAKITSVEKQFLPEAASRVPASTEVNRNGN